MGRGQAQHLLRCVLCPILFFWIKHVLHPPMGRPRNQQQKVTGIDKVTTRCTRVVLTRYTVKIHQLMRIDQESLRTGLNNIHLILINCLMNISWSGVGILVLYAAPNPVLPNKICLNHYIMMHLYRSQICWGSLHYFCVIGVSPMWVGDSFIFRIGGGFNPAPSGNLMAPARNPAVAGSAVPPQGGHGLYVSAGPPPPYPGENSSTDQQWPSPQPGNDYGFIYCLGYWRVNDRVPGVYRVVWNRVSFLVIITHECAARVCYYHQKAARDSIPHGKHLERGC